MKKILSFALAFFIVLVGGYIWGYWSEHQQLVQVQSAIPQKDQQITKAGNVARVAHLENELLALLDQAAAQNYGEAQKLSGRFFDEVRVEADRPTSAPYRQTLEDILARRDAVTAGLARADSTTVDPLRQSLDQLRALVENLYTQANL